MSTLFVVIKHIHVWCVLLSFGLFLVRAMWRLRRPAALNVRWIKITPHVIDTVLLASGLSMLLLLNYTQQLPVWLALKLGLVVLYIVCGILAFKLPRGNTPLFVIAISLFVSASFLAINKPFIDF